MRAFTALLAVALVLCLSLVASSSAQQDLRAPDQIAPATAAQQDLRAPDQIVAVASTSPQPAAASTEVTPASDGGISTIWIVLICIGGAMTLAAAAYTTTRAARAH
jgi:glucose/arabinose dehydrogenase